MAAGNGPPVDFYALRWAGCGLSQAQAAALLDVDVRTVKRWESGAARVPRAVVLLLGLLAGDLGALAPDWSGWTLDRRRGVLVSPAGWDLGAGEAAALPLTYAELEDARRVTGTKTPRRLLGGTVVPLRRRG